MALQKSDFILVNRGDDSYKSNLSDLSIWMGSTDSDLDIPVPLAGNGIHIVISEEKEATISVQLAADSGLTFDAITPDGGSGDAVQGLAVNADDTSIQVVNGFLTAVNAQDSEASELARHVETTSQSQSKDFFVFFGEQNGKSPIHTDNTLKYNPSTNELFSTKFNGAHVGDGSQLINLPFPEFPEIPPAFPSGTVMLFRQTNAPVGWTKQTTGIDNRALRVTTGAAGDFAGTGFTSVFTARTIPGQSVAVSGATVAAWNSGATLTAAQIASHAHTFGGVWLQQNNNNYWNFLSLQGGGQQRGATNPTNAAGSSGQHWHWMPAQTVTASGSSAATNLNMAVSYVDVISAVAN